MGMEWIRSNSRKYYVLLAVLLFLLPLLIPPFGIHLFIMAFMTCVATLSWTIIGGFAGQFSLGHVTFFGIGAYSSAILYTAGISPWLGMLVGILLSIVLTLIIGWPTFRLRGHYFALATIAIPTCLFYLSKYLKSLTQGSEGIALIFEPGIANMMFRSKMPWYYLTLMSLVIVLGMLQWIKRSKLIYYFLAIKEDEISAAAAGINPVYYKQIALTISVIFISMTGSFYVFYVQYISPTEAFDVNKGIYWAMLSILGGNETIVGPVLGVLLIEFINAIMKNFIGGWWGPFSNIIYGGILIAMTFWKPEGLIARRK